MEADIERHWSTVGFVSVRIDTHDGLHFFQADVAPGSHNPDHLRVELYADPAPGESARIVPHHLNALVPLEASQIIWQR
jgi:hypothetical protein